MSLGAHAESYNIGIPVDLNFGRIVSAATTGTTYTVNATGGITPSPGTLSNPSLSAGTVRISCGGSDNTCKNKKITVAFSSPGSSQNGRLGRLSAFNVPVSNTYTTSTNASTGTLTVTITSFPAVGPVDIKFGGSALVNSNAQGGGTGSNYTTPYTVTVTSSTSAVNTYSANAKATLLRGISVTKNSDLAFGIVVRPASGTGSISMSPSSPFPDAAGGAIWLDSTSTLAAVSRAKYTVTGEGGTSVAVQVGNALAGIAAPNGYFDMTGPGGTTIRVTTTTNVTASKSLGAVLGTEGSFTFFVGGSFNVPSTLPSGTYSGTFNVTVNYQ